MKYPLLLFCLFSLTISTFAQDIETRGLQDFTEVHTSEGIEVILLKGRSHTARVEVQGCDLDDVETEVSGNTLDIGMRDRKRFRNIDVKVYVTYVELTELQASSAGEISAKEVIESNELVVSASSAGEINIKIQVNELDAQASSAGEINIDGEAVNVRASASSAGEFNGYDLVAEEALVSASSAGDVYVHATDALRARASSGGDVRYKGRPVKQDIKSSSGGSVSGM